jgi:hypothetical protein
MSYPIQKPILSSEKTQIRNSRMVFANFVSQRQQVDFSNKIFTLKLTAGDLTSKNAGALFTTKEERDRILNLPSTGTSGVSDCPVNFNVLNAFLRALTGASIDIIKILTIVGGNITIQLYDSNASEYVTQPPFPIFEMTEVSDYHANTRGVYVNVSSGPLTIPVNITGSEPTNFILSPCGAVLTAGA